MCLDIRPKLGLCDLFFFLFNAIAIPLRKGQEYCSVLYAAP